MLPDFDIARFIAYQETMRKSMIILLFESESLVLLPVVFQKSNKVNFQATFCQKLYQL
jgi:hypothetical protein